MGVLANHVPSIEQLKPGLVEVIEESGGSKQFFCKSGSGDLIYGWLMGSEWRPCQKDKTTSKVAGTALTSMMSAVSGGFAIVQPGSQLSINAVEGFPLEDFSSDVNIFKHLIGLYYANKLFVVGCSISNQRSSKNSRRERK